MGGGRGGGLPGTGGGARGGVDLARSVFPGIEYGQALAQPVLARRWSRRGFAPAGVGSERHARAGRARVRWLGGGA